VRTDLGLIASLLRADTGTGTPLQQRLGRFGRAHVTIEAPALVLLQEPPPIPVDM